MTAPDRRRDRYATAATRPRRRTTDEAAEAVRLCLAIAEPLVAEVDRYAAAQRVSRPLAVEQLLRVGLASEAVDAALAVGLNTDPHRMVR